MRPPLRRRMPATCARIRSPSGRRAGPRGGVDGDVQRVRLDPVVPLQPEREPPATGSVLVDAEPGVPELVGEHALRGVGGLGPAHAASPGRVASAPRPTTTRATLRSDSEPGSK